MHSHWRGVDLEKLKKIMTVCELTKNCIENLRFKNSIGKSKTILRESLSS